MDDLPLAPIFNLFLNYFNLLFVQVLVAQKKYTQAMERVDQTLKLDNIKEEDLWRMKNRKR